MTINPATIIPARRTFEERRIWQLPANLVDLAVQLIAAAEAPHSPDLVIGIARGGLTPARKLSETMGVPYAMLTAQHNPDDRIRHQATGNVVLDDSQTLPDLTGTQILLVDDICGTGATLGAARAFLAAHGHTGQIRTAVLCRNTGSPVSPDTWVWDVADWTWFPWETTPDEPTQTLPVPPGVRHP